MPIEIITAAIRDDAHCSREIPQQGHERLLQVKDDRVIVRRLDATHGGKGSSFRAANFAAGERIEGPLYIARGEWLTILEAHPRAQMEDVSEGIGNLPTFSQPGLHVEVRITAHQRIEEQFVYALRLCVDTHARIEIRGAALNDHHQRVGIGLLRAACKKDNHRDTEAQRKSMQIMNS